MYFRLIENHLYECISNGDIDVVIPENVLVIGKDVFKGNMTIESVKLHSRIRKLEEYSFEGCSSLKEIKLPYTIHSIARGCFMDCTSLESVKLPRHISTVTETLFKGCTSLKTVELPYGAFTIENEAFAGCSSLEQIQLSGNITTIGSAAFKNCSSLREIELPTKLVYIRDEVFSGCVSLQKVVLPEELIAIDNEAFYNCGALSEIVLPERIQFIERDAFCGCSSLKEVRLPYELPKIKDNAFPSGTLLYLPYEGADISEWPSNKKFYAACGFIRQYMEDESSVSKEALESYCRYISKRRATLLPRFAKLEIAVRFLLKTEIYKLGDINALIDEAESTELKAYLLQYKQDHFTAEDEYRLMNRELNRDPFAVSEMKKLYGYTVNDDGTLTITKVKKDMLSIAMPPRIGRRKVTRIGKGLCESPIRLLEASLGPEQVLIPDGITEIEPDAFANCMQLKDIHIPDSVEYIAEGVFNGCRSLECIQLPDNLKVIGDGCFGSCMGLKSIVLPAQLECISRGMFNNCIVLKEVCINERVKCILDNAFAHCFFLESITIPASVSCVCDNAFSNCYSLKELIVKGRETAFLENSVPEECGDVTIYAPEGSAAQRYAEQKGIRFKIIDS